MSTLGIVLIIIAAILVFGVISFWLFMTYVSWRVYQGTLVRTSPEVWGRACSEPENEEQLEMWNRGLAWAESVGINTKEVQNGILKETDRYTDLRIENDGFQLYGQYIDFGADRAVIIIPGRCESLLYSFVYFSNQFVISVRRRMRCKGFPERESSWFSPWNRHRRAGTPRSTSAAYICRP